MTKSAVPGTELSSLVAVLRRRWAWIVLPAALAGVVASLLIDRIEPTFESSAIVLITDTEAQNALNPTSQNSSFLSRSLENEVTLAESDEAVSRANAKTGRSTEVDVTSDQSADVLVFTEISRDPRDAAVVANAWASVYIEIKQEAASQSLDAALLNLRRRLTDLQKERDIIRSPLKVLDRQIANAVLEEDVARLQSQRDQVAEDSSYEVQLLDSQAQTIAGSVADLELQIELAATGSARLIQEAVASSEPNNLPPTGSLVLIVAAASLIGLGLALVRDTLDDAIRTEGDIQSVTTYPVLAAVPLVRWSPRRRDPAFAVGTDPDSPCAAAFHRLRSAIDFASREGDVGSILVTSAGQSEGKTTTSANLASAMASIGRRTVLMDVDFRRPRLQKVFGVSGTRGLTDSVHGQTPVGELVVEVDSCEGNLLLLPTGPLPARPASFVAQPAFLDLVDWVASESDLVVLDAPPVLPVSDALTIAHRADAVLVAVRASKTTREELASALARLDQVGATVVGITLLGVRSSEGSYQYRYEGSRRLKRVQRNRSNRVPEIQIQSPGDGNTNPVPTGSLP